MTAIGETLRRERLRRNLDLEAVSRELKISPKLLAAIEAEKFDRLPGGVFAKSFVRQYARLLGLDEEEMAGEVQRMLQPAGAGPALVENPKPVQPIELPRVEAWEAVGGRRFKLSSPLPALALVVVVMMACAGVYSWWQRTRHVSAHDTTRAAATTGVTPAAAPAPPHEQPPAAQASAPAQGTPAAPPAETPAGQSAVAQPAAVPSVASAQQANATQSSTPSGPVRVELVADEPVWVLARTDGKFSFSGTLEPNQTRTVEANSKVELRLGNAGGVTITLNGKSIGAVGPKGQVRTVQLTSGGFEIVAAPKPPAVPLDPLL